MSYGFPGEYKASVNLSNLGDHSNTRATKAPRASYEAAAWGTHNSRPRLRNIMYTLGYSRASIKRQSTSVTWAIIPTPGRPRHLGRAMRPLLGGHTIAGQDFGI